MKRTDDSNLQLDSHLKQLDEDIVWNAERQTKLGYQIFGNLNKEETRMRFSRRFKAAASLMVCMILAVAGYIFISQTVGNDSASPGNGTETVPPVAGEPGTDENAEAIRAVIETEFNGPDKEYQALWAEMEEAQVSEEYIDDYEAFLESPEYLALMDYMDETYAPYFTENGYENFKNTSAFMYTTGIEQDYKLSTSNIEINQSEQGDTLYDFTFQVEYTDQNGNSETYDFEGDAIVPEEGKIGKIDYMDTLEDGLLQQLRNN